MSAGRILIIFLPAVASCISCNPKIDGTPRPGNREPPADESRSPTADTEQQRQAVRDEIIEDLLVKLGGMAPGEEVPASVIDGGVLNLDDEDALAKLLPWPDEEQYIPRDLEDCLVQLEGGLSPESLVMIRDESEEDMSDYHFGLGMGLRNGWGLWSGSRLAKWFNEKGVHHPDDMSMIILESFRRYLNDEPIKLEEQIEDVVSYWRHVNDEPIELEEQSEVMAAGNRGSGGI